MTIPFEKTALPTAAAHYEREGFCLVPQAVPSELVARAAPRMEAVMMGDYETGIAPMPMWKPGDDPTKLRKIDQAHLSDRALREVVSHPAIGAAAAAITGAEWIQVWAVQMLFKPPQGQNARSGGNVGWHQDWQYWQPWWEEGSEVFTAWLALSDVTAESGPMRFVPGSHQWGFLDEGNFFDGDLSREQIPVPDGKEWREEPAILPPGGVSFHHRHTYHGSGPNTSNVPRRSFAIHLRTEKSQPRSDSQAYYVSHLDDPDVCPVIFGAR